MQKYHITMDGKPAVCTAKAGRCPYFTDEEHLTSLESAIKMNDFKNNVEHNGVMALSSLTPESLTKNELKLYRKIVATTLRDLQDNVQNQAYDENNLEGLFTEAELAEIRKQSKIKVDEAYNDFQNKIEYNKKTFDFKIYRNNVPKGLLEGIAERRAKNELADYYLSDSNGNLDIELGSLLNKRLNGLVQSKLFRNFPHLLFDYSKIIDKNIERYKFALKNPDDIWANYDKDVESSYQFELKLHPKAKQAKANAKRGVMAVSTDRKAILANINREINIREQMEKFEGQPTIVNRLNGWEMPDEEEQVVTLDLKQAPDGQIDNLFVITNKNKLYKVTGIAKDKLHVVDDKGFQAALSTRHTAIRADLTGNFTFFETNTESTKPYHLNKKFLCK